MKEFCLRFSVIISKLHSSLYEIIRELLGKSPKYHIYRLQQTWLRYRLSDCFSLHVFLLSYFPPVQLAASCLGQIHNPLITLHVVFLRHGTAQYSTWCIMPCEHDVIHELRSHDPRWSASLNRSFK